MPNFKKASPQRPNGQGGTAECDTWDNATLNCDVPVDGQTVPMRLQQKRLASGQTNSWHFEAIGTEGGVRYNTRDANTIFIYEKEKYGWTRIDLNLQMWAAYAAERAGKNWTPASAAPPPEEAVLKSHAENSVIEL